MRDFYKRRSDPLVGLWTLALVVCWLVVWGGYAFINWAFERLAPLLG